MTLLLGDSETSFTSAEATTAEFARAFAFTAAETGLLEELQFRTNATANTGVTSVRLGVLADNGGAPGNLIQEGVFIGTPSTNTWITVSGIDIPILKNAKYWLVVLSIGGSLHYNVHGSGGTTSWCEANEEQAELYRCWEGVWGAAKAEGPLGFQGLGKAGIGTERKILFGINGGKTDNGHASTWISKAVIVGRGDPGLDANYTESPATISMAVAEALGLGICVPLVVINTEDEILLHNISAAIYAEKAAAIIKKVISEHPTVTTFELINEPYLKGAKEEVEGHTYPGSNASDYAAIVKATLERVTAEGITGVTLLVAAFGSYEKVNSSGQGTGEVSRVQEGRGWVADMLISQPTLKEGGAYPVTAWTRHPYGEPMEINEGIDYGFLTMPAIRQAAMRAGAAGIDNWWITECGFKVEGLESEAEQSSRLLEVLEQAQLMGEAGWLKALVVYDDSVSEPWNIYGRLAGTTYQNFVSGHGYVPAVVVSANFSAISAGSAKLTSARRFSARLVAHSTLTATITSSAIWMEATKSWAKIAPGLVWENVKRGEV